MPKDEPTPETLFYYRFAEAGLSREGAARLCGVSEATFHRWERSQQPINTAAYRLIKLHSLGIVQSSPWGGWRVHGGTLYSPEGVGITPGEIRALPYLLAINQTLRHQKERFSK